MGLCLAFLIFPYTTRLVLSDLIEVLGCISRCRAHLQTVRIVTWCSISTTLLLTCRKQQKAAEEAAAAAAPAEGVKPPKDKDKAIKELIKSIPRERKDVFAYSLKWDAFDANADAILPKLSKWVRV